MSRKKKIHYRFSEDGESVCGLGSKFDEIEWVSCRNCLRILTRERDGGICVDCGIATDRLLTMGHVVAQVNGGQWTYNNIVTQCAHHNSMLGSKTWREGWTRK